MQASMVTLFYGEKLPAWSLHREEFIMKASIWCTGNGQKIIYKHGNFSQTSHVYNSSSYYLILVAHIK